MNIFFYLKNKNNTLIAGLFIIILIQSFTILKFYSEKDDKIYQINLVKIKSQKDSLDFYKLKNDLQSVDYSIKKISTYLKTKNALNLNIENLSKDSLSSVVYLSNQSARYSRYLVELEKKLQEVPLGIPSSGNISSQFGMRKNPIPSKKILVAGKSLKFENNLAQDSTKKNNGISTNKKEDETEEKQNHKGIDIASLYGSDVYSAAKGKVIFAGQKSGYGNCIIIEHGNGLATLYGHLSKILVKTNQSLKSGEIIAKSGNSGRSTGPHLHYEVRKNNTPINPRLFLNL